MNAYPISFSVKATEDLDAIFDYVAKDSPAVAAQIVDRLVVFCNETLSEHPYIGVQANSLEKGLRSFNVSSYRVLYSVPNQSVLIRRIVHGSRDTKRLSL